MLYRASAPDSHAEPGAARGREGWGEVSRGGGKGRKGEGDRREKIRGFSVIGVTVSVPEASNNLRLLLEDKHLCVRHCEWLWMKAELVVH